MFASNHDQVGNRAVRRPPAARAPAPRRAVHALLAVHAAHLHGRGVRRAGAVSVLHRPHRRGDRGGDARRAAGGVRVLRRVLRRGRARSAGRRDVQALQADAAASIRRSPSCTAARLRCAASCRPATWTRSSFDADGPSLRVTRGPYARGELRGRGAVGARPRRTDRAVDVARRRAVRHRRPAAPAPGTSCGPWIGGAPMSRDVWPGGPFPLGPTWDGHGTNFSLFSEHATRVELCLFDARRHGGAHPRHRSHGVQLALLPARRRSGHALRLPRLRALPARGGAPLQPGEAAHRSLRQGDRGGHRLGGGQRAALRPRSRGPRGRRPRARRRGLRAPRSPSRWSSTSASTGRATSSRGRRGTRPSSTRCTSRASRCATPRSARTCAARTAAWRRSPRCAT